MPTANPLLVDDISSDISRKLSHNLLTTNIESTSFLSGKLLMIHACVMPYAYPKQVFLPMAIHTHPSHVDHVDGQVFITPFIA